MYIKYKRFRASLVEIYVYMILKKHESSICITFSTYDSNSLVPQGHILEELISNVRDVDFMSIYKRFDIFNEKP